MITTLTKTEIQAIKEKYLPGTRVMVDQMAPDPCPVAPGTVGTVDLVDDIGQIHCTFDNGRVLALVPDVDKFHIHHPKGAIKSDWLRSCLRLTADEFIKICQELYGPQVVVHFDMDGLWIDRGTGREDDWDVDDDRMTADLSEYFGINVMSVHIDDENNTDVWISYVPGKPKKAWYHISADGGKTWFKQPLTADEAAEQLVSKGYMLQKTTQLEAPPTPKVYAIFDYNECSLQVFADTRHLEAELIDCDCGDPCDPDYQKRHAAIAARRKEIMDAYCNNELFYIGER